MFLESSRSKFIGYTLGRWVSAEPAWGAADLRGVVTEAASVGVLSASAWQQRSPELTGSFLGWLLSGFAPACTQPGSFPSL